MIGIALILMTFAFTVCAIRGFQDAQGLAFASVAIIAAALVYGIASACVHDRDKLKLILIKLTLYAIAIGSAVAVFWWANYK